jgi:hypothetical protein
MKIAIVMAVINSIWAIYVSVKLWQISEQLKAKSKVEPPEPWPDPHKER